MLLFVGYARGKANFICQRGMLTGVFFMEKPKVPVEHYQQQLGWTVDAFVTVSGKLTQPNPRLKWRHPPITHQKRRKWSFVDVDDPVPTTVTQCNGWERSARSPRGMANQVIGGCFEVFVVYLCNNSHALSLFPHVQPLLQRDYKKGNPPEAKWNCTISSHFFAVHCQPV